jgi:hypothetical protein
VHASAPSRQRHGGDGALRRGDHDRDARWCADQSVGVQSLDTALTRARGVAAVEDRLDDARDAVDDAQRRMETLFPRLRIRAGGDRAVGVSNLR